MKLAILAGVTVLVLATLATSFPLVVAAQTRTEERSANIEDHMTFTREIAEQSTKLDALSDQHKALMGVPERMARVEERLDIVVRMVYAILAGVGGLLLKELLGALSTRAKRNSI